MSVEQHTLDRLTNRYLLRLAVQEVCSTPQFQSRTASLRDLTPAVLEAFGQALLPSHGRVAGNFFSKIKGFLSALTKAPQVWEAIKKFLRVTKITDLVGAISKLIHQAYAGLLHAVNGLFKVFPFYLFRLPKNQVLSLNALLNALLGVLKAKSPKAFHDIGSKIGGFVKGHLLSAQEWWHENGKALMPGLISVLKKVFDNPVMRTALYWYIWNEVTEFEWDLNGLTKAAMGQITMDELLASLPSSGMGALLGKVVSGTFTLLPQAILARMVWLITSHFFSAESGEIKIHWERFALFTHIPEAELKASLGAAAGATAFVWLLH